MPNTRRLWPRIHWWIASWKVETVKVLARSCVWGKSRGFLSRCSCRWKGQGHLGWKWPWWWKYERWDMGNGCKMRGAHRKRANRRENFSGSKRQIGRCNFFCFIWCCLLHDGACSFSDYLPFVEVVLARRWISRGTFPPPVSLTTSSTEMGHYLPSLEASLYTAENRTLTR